MSMIQELDYTSRARKFVTQYPVISHISPQTSFWTVAYVLFAIIIHITSLNFSIVYSTQMDTRAWSVVLMGGIIGALYGSTLGMLDYFFDRQFFRNKPLGRIIILKAFLSLVLLIICFNLMRFVLFQAILAPMLTGIVPDNRITDVFWGNLFLMVLIYSFFMTLIITFIIQVNKKYGPGVLLPLLLGKYRNPREEERAFMFMDLKSSTAIAEALGHLKYSSFIRDCFMDINHVLHSYNAEVYQYVGDEIVISWRVNNHIDYRSCVQFFFACEIQFELRRDDYVKNYGLMPSFKAGLHMGKVTAVEIGEIKRDIAYHGDTLNTTARIQSMCNEYGRKLLVSAYFIETGKLSEVYITEELGKVMLRGKTEPVDILSINNRKS